MKIVFDSGWLVGWTNKKTGETVNFGKPAPVADGQPGWVYQPGAWWHPSERPKVGEKGRAKWSLKAASPAPDQVAFTQTLSDLGNAAEAVQWSLQIPLDKVDLHVPWILAPARMATGAFHSDAFDRPSYYFEKRTGVLSFHEWRQRFYILQGKTGGLLIYVDDPNFDSRQALEWDFTKPMVATIANRSMGCAPISANYTSSKWVIHQYQGWLNNGVQMYQDYLEQSYKIKPLVERPTKWVSNLAFCLSKPSFLSPPKYEPGSGDKLDYTNWKENLATAEKQIDDLAKVMNPDQTMFYITAWRQAPHDCNFPSNDVDPWFTYTCQMARKRGFHVMLHMHNDMIQDQTTFYQRYIRQLTKRLGGTVGATTADDIPYGIGIDALRNGGELVQKNKDFGGSYYRSMGVNTVMTGFHMHPGWEAYRYMKVANIVAALQSTGADMVHLDVPSIWHDQKDDRFKENMAQGMRELYKLLRETLDARGMANVAIACEGMPHEPILPYVDMGQMARATSIKGILASGASEDLIELQTGDDLDKINAARAKAAATKVTGKFDPDRCVKLLTGMPDIGQPSVMAMACSPYVLGYPHLGNFGPTDGGRKGDPKADIERNVTQALQVWWSLSNNTIPNTQDSIMPEHPVSDGRLELAAFWEKNLPKLAPPSEWRKGDLTRFRLRDNSLFWVTRIDPTTLRFNLEGGKVLAELNVLDGWKNDAILKSYLPPQLKEVRAKDYNKVKPD